MVNSVPGRPIATVMLIVMMSEVLKPPDDEGLAVDLAEDEEEAVDVVELSDDDVVEAEVSEDNRIDEVFEEEVERIVPSRPTCCNGCNLTSPSWSS